MSLMRRLVVASLLALALADVDQPCDEALNESSKQTWRFSELFSTVPFSATAEPRKARHDACVLLTAVPTASCVSIG